MNHGKAYLAEKKICWPTCKACHDALVRHRKRVVYRRTRGTIQKRIDPAETLRMIDELLNKYNYSYQQIADEAGSGISLSYVRKLGAPSVDRKYVYSRTEDAIRRVYDSAIDMTDYHPRLTKLRKAELSRRAIGGLMRQGWDQKWIGEQIGVTHDTLSKIMAKRQLWVSIETEEKLVALARRVGSQEGPSGRARKYAEKRGWRQTIYTPELV